jgi:hopanoid biosynthesis associated protein HpnK
MVNRSIQSLQAPKTTNNSSQSRFLVVNGDDFGFSSSVNSAIAKAHDNGILTSTSLIVTGEAFEEAVELAKARPQLAVGLHLVLICGQSVLPPSQIPHLVNSQGYFSNDPVRAGWHYQFSQAAQREILLEIRAQLEKFRQTGLPLSHVDGHLHLHMHPVVLRALVELANEFEIRFIRLPTEELKFALDVDRSNFWTKLVWFLVFGRLRRYGEHLLRASGVQYVDRVYGLLQTGQMTEDYLLKLIPKIQAKRVEIYSHPAVAAVGESFGESSGQGPEELEALLSDRVRNQLTQNGFTLTNYCDQRMSLN